MYVCMYVWVDTDLSTSEEMYVCMYVWVDTDLSTSEENFNGERKYFILI
jgi:hypothetical protein